MPIYHLLQPIIPQIQLLVIIYCYWCEHKKKTWELLLLLIPHLEALALPDIEERATLIAHADMNIASPYRVQTEMPFHICQIPKGMRIYTSRGHLCCLILDNIIW